MADTGIRKTKMVATLGLASTSPAETVDSLLTAGVNVLRLNLSYGTLEEHERTLAL